MEEGRQHNKSITSVEGTGLSQSGTQSVAGAQMIPFSVSTTSQDPHIIGEEDSARTMTGPNVGDYASGSPGHTQKWGHTTHSGSQIIVDDTPGSEAIDIIHHSGAGVKIEADGSVYVASSSRRGMGLGAPRGDFFITAGGEIVIDGPGTISIKTAGDLNLVVGGTLNIVAGAIKTTTKSLEENIDGYSTRSVTNDQSTIVGGSDRLTVAGDRRMQVANNLIEDVGVDKTVSIDGNSVQNITGTNTVKVKGDSSTQVQGDLSSVSDGTTSIGSTGDMSLTTAANLTQGASGNLSIAADGTGTIGSKGQMQVSTDGAIRLSGQTADLSSTGQTTVSGSTSTIGGSTVRLATGSVQGPIPSGSGGSVSTFKDAVPAVSDVDSTEAPDAADFPPPEDVIDSMTSVRKYPDYPTNAVREGAYATNIGQISYDSTPGADQVYGGLTSGNQGNQYPASVGGSIDTLSDQPVNRDPNITAALPDGYSIPARGDTSAKISRYFTLGTLINAPYSHTIPTSSWKTVVENHILVAYNILDPLKEKFPDIIITNAYRANSSNHVTGRAVDIVVPSRSLQTHAEIARFCRDNLPAEKVLLERNDSGRTHVHVQVTPSGQKGNPIVFTCGDKKCNSRVPGIQVEWLQRGSA